MVARFSKLAPVLLFGVLGVTSVGAQASLVRWTILDAIFDDGGSLTGFFDVEHMDHEIPGLPGVYGVAPKSINVTASTGATVNSSTAYGAWRSVTASTHYLGAEASLVDITFGPFPDLQNWTSLYFDYPYASPENLIANIWLDLSGQSLQNDLNDIYSRPPSEIFERQLVSGYVSGEILLESIPVTATAWLFSVAILGLGVFRRRSI